MRRNKNNNSIKCNKKYFWIYILLLLISVVGLFLFLFGNIPELQEFPFDMIFGMVLPIFGGQYSITRLLALKIGADAEVLKIVPVIWFFIFVMISLPVLDKRNKQFIMKEEQKGNYYLMTAKYKTKDRKTCYLQALSDNHISIHIPDKWGDIYREHRYNPILVKKTLGGYSRIIKGRLSAEEKKKYYTPVLFVGGKEQKTFSKEEQIEAFHNSHKCLGFIYDKQEYGLFKIGVNDSITRYHVMDTKLKNYDRLYSTVNIGDTVILRVSDSIPQLTQVLSWDPSFEEKKRYKTPVKLVEKVPTYQIATIYDKWDYVRAYSARRNTYHYQVKLKISDDIKTKYINIDDAFPKFIYNSIKEGDTVLINLPKYNLSVVEVVNWHPTSEEKIKYKRPVKLKSAN